MYASGPWTMNWPAGCPAAAGASNITSRSTCTEYDGPATEGFGHLTYPVWCGVDSVDDGTTPDRSSNGVGTIHGIVPSRPIEPRPTCLVPRLEPFWKLLRKNNGRNGSWKGVPGVVVAFPSLGWWSDLPAHLRRQLLPGFSRHLRRLNRSGRFLEAFWNLAKIG